MNLNDNNKTNKQLIVIGNGFDLQCNLKTRYQDFFDFRFGITLQNQINKYLDIDADAQEEFYKELSQEINLNQSATSIKTKSPIIYKTRHFIMTYLSKLKTQISKEIKDHKIKSTFLNESTYLLSMQYSEWDTIFLLTKYYLAKDSMIQWNEVENIIFKIVSIILLNDDKTLLADLKFKPNLSKDQFIASVKGCFNEDKNKVAVVMLNELQTFESNFAIYIDKIKKESEGNKEYPNYYLNSFELLIDLMHVQEKNILDVLSFNYSLDISCLDGLRGYFDDRFNNKNKLTINSWSNIHGIAAYKDYVEKNYILAQSVKTVGKNIQLPVPIFGIDNHDILKPDKNDNIDFDDPRSIFTKSFRLLDNHVNNIRTKTFQKDIDVITFLGHSLNQADYSYFESIFDQYDIFHSNVKLEFYYYPGDSGIDTKSNERKMMRKVVNLLTSYGATLKNEHGENIVNKLILEQRLTVLPNPKISIPENLKNSLL